MKQKIDINLFYENPQYLFTQLPEKAKDEVSVFIQYIIFKYNIGKEVVQPPKTKNQLIDKFSKFRTGLPSDYKFNREEANER